MSDTKKHNEDSMKPLVSRGVSAIKGECTVAGDKSISHRALMFGSQVLGTTKIHGLLEGEDVLRTATALKSLSVAINRDSQGIWSVIGVGVGGLAESTDVLDMGNSGTSTRLLMGLVTPYDFTTFFTGDDSLRSRPMKRVITPLSQIGATFNARDGDRLPLALKGTKNPLPITYKLPVASAQVKSAILLAGLNTAGITTVIEKEPTRDHTENMLEYFGFNIKKQKLEDGSLSISVTGQPAQKLGEYEIYVPADPSSAAFLAVAAIICPDSELTIRNVCVNPLRIGLFTTLKEMGANIEFLNECKIAGEPVTDIHVKHSKLKAVTVPTSRAPSMIDEYPILAVAAAFAKGESVMHGLSELRVKESDRLSAIIAALTACGVSACAENDSLYIKGLGTSPKGGATVITNFDHRIAMAFLVMGMASKEPITVDDATAIATSFPNFSELCNSLGANISSPRLAASSNKSAVVVAIDGPAASGKGTLARRLAEHFNMYYLDTGSLYRAVGMKIIYSGKDPNNHEDALEAARNIDAEDLANPRLRQERIGQAASIVSAFPEVRKELLEFQRRFAKNSVIAGRGAVLDGRDIGTVVCPDADLKFFITATLFTRAKRRHKELEGEGIQVIFDSVLADLRERDERDEKRAIAPMRPADDAYIIDSSKLDASEVFETSRRIILQKAKNIT